VSGNVGSLVVDLIARTSGFLGPMRGAGSEIRNLGASVDALGGRISSVVMQIASMAGAVGGIASVGWGVKLAADTEQATIGFTTLLGSAETAKKMMGELETFAASTPFQFPELAASARKMLALGFAADEVMPVLTTLGDAASGLGGGAELLDRITVALGQMRTKGVVSGEEMRQLAEAGIPAWKLLNR
jgi:phage tail tape-measure protein